MANEDAIRSAVQSLQAIYTIALTLSFGESFRQFVPNGGKTDGQKISWDRLPVLCCFLLLIVPFVHGMNRYFFDVYMAGPRPSPYAIYLLLDCAVFTVEAGLFFVLARSQTEERWSRFFATVLVLLALDVVWAAFVWLAHTPVIRNWMLVNFCTLPVLGVAWYYASSKPWMQLIGVTAIIGLRTVADYWTSWSLYFPQP